MPLSATAPLSLLDCVVFDLPVHYRSNDIRLAAWLGKAFPGQPLAANSDNQQALQIDIQFEEQDAVDHQPPGCEPFNFQLQGPKLRAVSSLGVMEANGLTGKAFARLSRDVLVDIEFFLQEVLICLTLFLVCWQGRFPIHAAAVQMRGTTLLLLGDSGAGKSTLAYTAWRGGWNLISEDTVYFDWRYQSQVWALPRHIQVLPDSVHLFPELRALQPINLPNGKTKIRIPLKQPVTIAGNLVLCLLQPAHRKKQSGWQSTDSRYIVDRIFAGKETGFDIDYPFRDRAREALYRLPGVNLQVGRSLPDAQRTLLEIVDAHPR